MDDTSHVFDFVFDGLRPKGNLRNSALPLAANSDTMDAASRAIIHDGRGAAVLLRLEDLMHGNPRKAVVDFAAGLGIALDELDIILDLRAPNFEPYAVFANALVAALKRLGNLHEVRNFVLLGTAIPTRSRSSLRAPMKSPHDWKFFKTLLDVLPAGMRRPLYGDHTVVHPDFTAVDMRKVKAAGKIIYTTPGTWGTRKGGAFRDNPAQMYGHCERVIAEPAFAFRAQALLRRQVHRRLRGEGRESKQPVAMEGRGDQPSHHDRDG